jgi:hypothetical protein
MRCLRHILKISWKDKVTNKTVLQKANLTSPNQAKTALLADGRWAYPKRHLYGEIANAPRPRRHPKLCYKDVLNVI